jgi:hypothetical protein
MAMRACRKAALALLSEPDHLPGVCCSFFALYFYWVRLSVRLRRSVIVCDEQAFGGMAVALLLHGQDASVHDYLLCCLQADVPSSSDEEACA